MENDISQAGFCPKCQRENKKSKVYPDDCITETLMGYRQGYYDENGIYIKGYNPNIYEQGMSCSEGHRWFIKASSDDHRIISIDEDKKKIILKIKKVNFIFFTFEKILRWGLLGL